MLSGGAEAADQGVEPFDVGVALEDTPETSEESLVALIGEKAGGHGLALGADAPGHRLGLGAVGGAGAVRNENLPHCHRPRGMYLRENAQGCSKKVRAGQRCRGDVWHAVPDARPSPGSSGDHGHAAAPGYLLANLRVARHLREAGSGE